MAEERIQKIISRAGLMSRRSAEELIAAGRVTVDGRPAKLGDRAEAVARIEIDGALVPTAPGLVTYLLNKPRGVISTSDDPYGRSRVTDLVPPEPRVWPVGRLDADSEGLLLLTNDGELTHRVTHPSHGVHKTYLALMEGDVSSKSLRRLTAGVDLEDGPARAVSARVVDRAHGLTTVELVMAEGRKREVRRMGEAIGHPVKRLVRTAIGPLSDRDLKPGEWRVLTPGEVAALYRARGRGGR